MKRYTITIPNVDNHGRQRPDFREFVERELRAAGLSAWTVLSGSGVWNLSVEPVTVYVLDGSNAILTDLMHVAEEFRAYADQQAVYVTAEPIESYLVDGDLRDSRLAMTHGEDGHLLHEDLETGT